MCHADIGANPSKEIAEETLEKKKGPKYDIADAFNYQERLQDEEFEKRSPEYKIKAKRAYYVPHIKGADDRNRRRVSER